MGIGMFYASGRIPLKTCLSNHVGRSGQSFAPFRKFHALGKAAQARLQTAGNAATFPRGYRFDVWWNRSTLQWADLTPDSFHAAKAKQLWFRN